MTLAQAAGPLLLLAFWAACLVDFARTDPADYQRYDRSTWLLLLILTNIFGGMWWLVAGRPRR